MVRRIVTPTNLAAAPTSGCRSQGCANPTQRTPRNLRGGGGGGVEEVLKIDYRN